MSEPNAQDAPVGANITAPPTPTVDRRTLNPGRTDLKNGVSFSQTRLKVSGLNPRQHKFAHLYLKYLNATKAATEAGYSAKSADDIGGQLLASPRVKHYIETLQRRIAASVRELTPERIASELWDTAQVCAGATPILDRQGEATGEYRIDSAGRNKALELLGRYKGMFNDRVDHIHTMRVEDLSEEQVMALLGRLDQMQDAAAAPKALPAPLIDAESEDISKA